MVHLQYILESDPSNPQKQKPLKAIASKGLSGVHRPGLEPGTNQSLDKPKLNYVF